MSEFPGLTEAVVAGKRKDAVRLTQEYIDAKEDPGTILKALIEGMDIIGDKFQKNEAWVPELLIASRAMKQSLELLEPLLVDAGIQPEHTAVIGTVEGDLHDIGKNLVAMMWRGANFNVVDLGCNVSADTFLEAAKEHKADVIGLSALLTTTMPSMKTTIEQIKAAGLDTKVLIGGAPITQEFANEIGADGFAADAAGAVALVREIVKN